MKAMFGKLKSYIRNLREDEDGGGYLVVTPMFCILFLMLSALAFNVALWGQKKQELQIMADCASRAGALAVDKQYAVLESNGKYHVYTELDPSTANQYANEVLEAFETKGMEYSVYAYNPNGVKAPEWSSRDHQYYDKYLTSKKQYYNGDFTVILTATIHGIWEDLLNLSGDHDIWVSSQSIATGTASR